MHFHRLSPSAAVVGGITAVVGGIAAGATGADAAGVMRRGDGEENKGEK
jgi:hypothetical protein